MKKFKEMKENSEKQWNDFKSKINKLKESSTKEMDSISRKAIRSIENFGN